MEKILVFGAGGFIGTYLVDRLLESGYEVVASDNNDICSEYYDSIGVDYVKLDITSQEEFRKVSNRQYSAIVNLAAMQPANVSEKNYSSVDYIRINVLGTLNILNFCIQNGVKRFVSATSHRNTQGLWYQKKPIREEDGRSLKYSGQYSMFSISESAAQDCILHYTEEYGLRGIILRLPPVYGYGPHTEIFMDGKPIKTGFRIFIDNAKEHKPLQLWGNADIGRDVVYVKDVVAAFLQAIRKTDVCGIFNIASGYKLSIREEAKIIADVFWEGNSDPVFIDLPEKENNIEEFVYDISKAKEELEWTPLYSFKDMLLDTIEEQKKDKYHYLIEKRKIQLQNN